MMERTAIRPRVVGWEEVDLALKHIGEIDLEMQQIELEGKEVIRQAELRIEQALAPLAERRKRIEAEIYAFASARVADFGKRKSKNLSYGKVDRRNTPAKIEQLPGVSVEETAERIRKMMPEQYEEFVVERPQLVKVKLRELAGDVLARLGLKKTSEQNQWGIKINYDKVKEALGGR